MAGLPACQRLCIAATNPSLIASAIAGYRVNTSDRIVVVIGGSGFIGRHVVQALARSGYRVRVAVRRPDLANHLQPLGFPGQIMPVQANLRFPESLERAAASSEQPWIKHMMLEKSDAHCIYCRLFESTHHAH